MVKCLLYSEDRRSFDSQRCYRSSESANRCGQDADTKRSSGRRTAELGGKVLDLMNDDRQRLSDAVFEVNTARECSDVHYVEPPTRRDSTSALRASACCCMSLATSSW